MIILAVCQRPVNGFVHEKRYLDKTGDTYFYEMKKEVQGYSMVVTEKCNTPIWICSESHGFQPYSEEDEMVPRNGPQIKQMEIGKLSMFVGHRCVQYTSMQWRRE